MSLFGHFSELHREPWLDLSSLRFRFFFDFLIKRTSRTESLGAPPTRPDETVRFELRMMRNKVQTLDWFQLEFPELRQLIIAGFQWTPMIGGSLVEHLYEFSVELHFPWTFQWPENSNQFPKTSGRREKRSIEFDFFYRLFRGSGRTKTIINF